MRKFLLRSLIVLAVLAALGGIALLIERHSAKAAWESYAAAAKARGVKLSLKDEMVQPPIPDAENFAAVPIFAQFFKPSAADGPSIQIFQLPRLKLSKPGTTTSLEEWRNLLVEEKWLAADAPGATPEAILRVLDERFGADWQQLRNQLRSNEYVDEMLARIDAASGRYIPTPLGKSLLSPAPRRLERLNYALFYEVMPVYSTMENVALFTHTRVQCARTAVALERWRLAHGAYPDSLAALVPGLLPVVPHDVIDGQPLRYRRAEEGGYLLYSIAIDGKDDGGTGPKPRTSDKDAPDWVWKP